MMVGGGSLITIMGVTLFFNSMLIRLGNVIPYTPHPYLQPLSTSHTPCPAPRTPICLSHTHAHTHIHTHTPAVVHIWYAVRYRPRQNGRILHCTKAAARNSNVWLWCFPSLHWLAVLWPVDRGESLDALLHAFGFHHVPTATPHLAAPSNRMTLPPPTLRPLQPPAAPRLLCGLLV